MDRRVRITLPEPLVCVLERMADEEDEPVARVAARLVRDQLDQLRAGGRRAPSTHRAVPERRPGERPPWLEPYGGDREWRVRIWGEIIALYGRYPTQLRGLQEGWWNVQHILSWCVPSSVGVRCSTTLRMTPSTKWR